MVRRIPTFFLFVIRLDRTQVQLIDQVADEVRQVSFWQPIPQAGRQQQVLFGQVRPVGFSHPRKLTHPSCEFQALSEVRCRLLGRAPSITTLSIKESEVARYCTHSRRRSRSR